MEIVWKFNPDDPEDANKLIRFDRALDIELALWDFSQWLRGKLKYQDNLTEEEMECLERVKEEFYKILGEHSVDLDSLAT